MKDSKKPGGPLETEGRAKRESVFKANFCKSFSDRS